MRVIVSGEYRAFLMRPSRNFRVAIAALENLLAVGVPELHHADRPTGALNRVVCEDFWLWGLLEFDLRGNPEANSEGMFAHLNLVCAVLEVGTGAYPHAS